MKYLFIYLITSFISVGLISTSTVNPSIVENSNTVEIDTVANKPLHYEIYDKNCNLLEDGFWENGKNVGLYKRFYENGQIAEELNFDNQGRRVGVQKYFHENGEASLIGVWTNGKVDGFLVRYHEKGHVTELNLFDSGVLCSN